MTLGDPVFDLYLNNKFIKISSLFYETDEIRLRDIQSWIHPHSLKKRNKFSIMAPRPGRF